MFYAKYHQNASFKLTFKFTMVFCMNPAADFVHLALDLINRHGKKNISLIICQIHICLV